MKQPLSNLQLELLKAFSRDVSDEDVSAIKRLITRYFAQKAIAGSNRVWDEQRWDDEKIQELLHTHQRTPYLPKQKNS